MNDAIKLEIWVSGCFECPYCKTKEITAGEDGRETRIVYYCEKGVFGSKKRIPKPPKFIQADCPLC